MISVYKENGVLKNMLLDNVLIAHHTVKNKGHNKPRLIKIYLDQTIADGGGSGTRPGPHLLIPIPLFCLAEDGVQHLQRLLEDPQVLTWFFTEIKTCFTDGRTFTLAHSGDRACGIPDGDTFVMVGGGEQIHNFATR